MPQQEHLNPETISQPRGYTQVVKAGNTVYIAGQVAVAPDGSVVGQGDPPGPGPAGMEKPGCGGQVNRRHPPEHCQDHHVHHQY
jgi:hypothetical protein